MTLIVPPGGPHRPRADGPTTFDRSVGPIDRDAAFSPVLSRARTQDDRRTPPDEGTPADRPTNDRPASDRAASDRPARDRAASDRPERDQPEDRSGRPRRPAADGRSDDGAQTRAADDEGRSEGVDDGRPAAPADRIAPGVAATRTGAGSASGAFDAELSAAEAGATDGDQPDVDGAGPLGGSQTPIGAEAEATDGAPLATEESASAGVPASAPVSSPADAADPEVAAEAIPTSATQAARPSLGEPVETEPTSAQAQPPSDTPAAGATSPTDPEPRPTTAPVDDETGPDAAPAPADLVTVPAATTWPAVVGDSAPPSSGAEATPSTPPAATIATDAGAADGAPPRWMAAEQILAQTDGPPAAEQASALGLDGLEGIVEVDRSQARPEVSLRHELRAVSASAEQPAPRVEGGGSVATPQGAAALTNTNLTNEAVDELWSQVQRALHRVRNGADSQELRLRLRPAELGELLVQVRTQGDQLTVRLVASSSAAHQTLVADSQRLAAELAAAGFADGMVDIDQWGEQQGGNGGRSPDEERPAATGSSRGGESVRPDAARPDASRPKASPSRRAGLVDLTL